MLECIENGFYKSPCQSHTSRYCNQKLFKLLVCGVYNSETYITSTIVNCIDVNKLADVETYPPMKLGRDSLEVIYFKGDIYVFGGWNNNGCWINIH